MDIQLAMQAYEGASKVIIDGECQNFYMERNPAGSKSPVALIGTPGLKLWTSVGDGPIRGMILVAGNLFVISGTELYYINRSKASTLVGTVLGTANVHLVENGTDVLIIAGAHNYAARKSQILEIPEPNLVGAAYQDGYGIAAKSNTEQFYLSNNDDLTLWTATDFSSADTFADNLVTLISDHRELWLFGERTTEIWHNTGNAAFPFQRAGSGFIERGCLAPGAVAKEANSVFWPGDDYQVYQASGYTPKPISRPGVTRLIEQLIASEGTANSAWSFTYTQEGHTFYVLNFNNLSLVYDLTTGLWHTRKSWGINRWRANCYANPWQLKLVGDYENGNIYELDMDTYDDNGDTIVRRATSMPINPGAGVRGIMDEFFLDMETGVGLTTGQGSDPQMMLDWSDNGGKTWSNEHWAPVGKIGEYTKRVRWQRLGSFRQRILRLSISDPVKSVIVKAKARVEKLST